MAGTVNVALLIDVFSRHIVSGRTSASKRTDLYALERAVYDGETEAGWIHHSDCGSQCVSIRYTERLKEAGIESSVGRRGDTYVNSLLETMVALFKTGVIRQAGPWHSLDDVAYATLECIA